MDEQTEKRIFDTVDRALNLFELWITRKYPVKEEKDGEVWRKGDPLPEPQTVAEYREFPREGKGRFQEAIDAAQRNRY